MRHTKDLESEGASAEQTGFSGTCRNASLADWIQLIQMGRRDAVIAVRVPGHTEGRLWCQRGDIIDACWGSLTGEDAAYRMLSFESGDVSVEFATFERPRAIRTSSGGLLLEAAYRRDTRVPEHRASTPPAAPQGAGGGGSHSTAPTVTGPPSLPPLLEQARNLRALFWVGATALFGLAFLLSWRVGSHAPAAASGGLPTAAPPADVFPVHVEAQPDEAEIRLDGQVVATRALMTWLPRDGRSHELIVSARGYVPELVTFRDGAPLQQIALERLSADTEPAPARLDDGPSRGARRAPLTHRAPSPVQETANDPSPAAAPQAQVSAAAKAKIQTIDERQPRIQAIDDDRPRIESVE